MKCTGSSASWSRIEFVRGAQTSRRKKSRHYSDILLSVTAESCWTRDSHGAGFIPGVLLTGDVTGGEIFYF